MKGTQVPPNLSRREWIEELEAVGAPAAWQAVRDFDPEQGVPLAGFGYCRVMTRCLARYRREWSYALHFSSSDSCERESTPFKHSDLAALSSAKINRSHPSNDHLRAAVNA